MLRFTLLFLLGFVLAVGCILIFKNANKNLVAKDNLVITVFEKGDKIPANWIEITPNENFKIREFGQRCVLFNNELFTCDIHQSFPVFNISDIEGEDSHCTTINFNTAPTFMLGMSWGEYVKDKPELQAFKDICK